MSHGSGGMAPPNNQSAEIRLLIGVSSAGYGMTVIVYAQL
jgi:hypothetical protein